MPAVPFIVIVLGYWVMYSGVKRVSMLDAWNCKGQISQTPVNEPGSISVSSAGSPQAKANPQPVAKAQPAADPCALRGGDFKISIPFTTRYYIWRPQTGATGAGAVITGGLVGPCG